MNEGGVAFVVHACAMQARLAWCVGSKSVKAQESYSCTAAQALKGMIGAAHLVDERCETRGDAGRVRAGWRAVVCAVCVSMHGTANISLPLRRVWASPSVGDNKLPPGSGCRKGWILVAIKRKA